MSAELAPSDPVDVAIVGAGPTGLFGAILLARQGVRVRIFDEAPGAAKESRAFAVQARTLELMHAIGLAETFLDRGTLATGARIHVDGHVAAGSGLDFGRRTDTPFPIVMILPQFETERILVGELDRLGVAVERGVAIATLTQDEDGVTARGTGPDGDAVSVRASYLVGADGAHSVVRKALGLSFEGAPYPQGFLLADCRVDGPLEDGPLSVFLHGHDFAMWFPMKGERVGRVLATDPAVPGDGSIATQGTAPATLADVEAAFRRASQRDLRLSEPVWTSRYRVHHRGVNRYRVGRVFVAGDAAHIHSPAGGQGMNTGLQDAANLAWKLASAVRGTAPPDLLDSYDAERRPVGETVLSVTDKAFTFMTSSSGLVSRLRDLVIPFVGPTVGRSRTVRDKAFGFLSQLNIRYEPGPAVAAEDGGWDDGPKPGRRAPDAAITRTVSVFDRLAGYDFHLLALVRRPLHGGEIDETADALEAAAAASGLPLRTSLVAHSLVGRHARLVQAENDAVLRTYGVSGEVAEALYLVRPDGHVAWRSPSLDMAGCRSFIRDRCAAPRTPSAP